jgi:hypothetical protein
VDDLRRLPADGAAALDEVLRECLAYVAEHYVPWDERGMAGEEYLGSCHDNEHIWVCALNATIGSGDLWERFEAPSPKLTAPETAIVARACMAYTWVFVTATQAATHLEDEVRLFGDAAEMPEHGTPEWTALFAVGALDPPGSLESPGTRGGLANYLYNVCDGLIDATGAFHDYDDEED